MENGEKIADYYYFSRVQIIVNQMKAWGDPMSNQIVLDKVMQTLSEKFNYVVAAIETSKDLSTMKVEELQKTLKAHEQWLLEMENGEKIADYYYFARVQIIVN